jgi:hypothetical protein
MTSKYEPKDIEDLLLRAGFKLDNARTARKIVKALYDGGLMQPYVWSNGLGWEIKVALETLAHTRTNLPIKEGDRVIVRHDQFEQQVERWKQQNEKSVRATFSEAATVECVEFSGHSDSWIALVKFDKEYYVYQELKEVELKSRHTWPFRFDTLQVIGRPS